MNRIYLLIISILLPISLNAQENLNLQAAQENAKSVLPQGVMTYNVWSGKISVGGQTIERELWDRYFSPNDLASFKSGKAMDLAGGIIAGIGAVPFGYGLGYMIGWKVAGGPTSGDGSQSFRNAEIACFVGLGIVAIGAAVGIPGSVKMKKAIKNYNLSLTYSPELRFGATDHGLGLAYAF